MKFNLLNFCCAFLISSAIFPQSIDLPIDYVRNKSHSQNTTPEAIEGSKYIEETFQNGKIIFNKKEIPALLRYNILVGEFEIKDFTSQEVTSVIPSRDLKFIIGSTVYALHRYIRNNNTTEGYFEILNEGPIQLLKKTNATYNEAKPAANSYSKAKPARYTSSTEYYISKNNAPAQPVLLRKKNILAFINSDSARNYIKDNKLKLKTEKEAVLLLNFLNKNN